MNKPISQGIKTVKIDISAMAAKQADTQKPVTAKEICDGLKETPSCIYVALFRNKKRVIGYQPKDQQFSRSPAGTQLERIQKELENVNTPPNVYEIRYTSSLQNSDGYESVYFNKKIGRIYSINDSIDKVELPRAQDYKDKNANDVLIEIAELRITNQYLSRDNEELQEANDGLQNEIEVLRATLETLESELEANNLADQAEEPKTFLTKVLENPSLLDPIVNKAAPLLGFVFEKFFPSQAAPPKEKPAPVTNGQAKQYPNGFEPLPFENEQARGN